jgi:hypothetical protein
VWALIEKREHKSETLIPENTANKRVKKEQLEDEQKADILNQVNEEGRDYSSD